ncbi:MAG: Flagellar motor switch protein FliN [Chlamydiae bacterium]|nr:Flagellar motor switch protein FliN [Chlamydiota bacterium]
MSEFTSEEIEGITKAIAQEPSKSKDIPLREPGSYGPISKVLFSAFEEEPKERDMTPLTEKEKSDWGHLKVDLEVVFGSTKIPLKELASLEEGCLLPLDQLGDEKVEIFANGKRIARGEIVALEDHFGVQITSFEDKAKS